MTWAPDAPNSCSSSELFSFENANAAMPIRTTRISSFFIRGSLQPVVALAVHRNSMTQFHYTAVPPTVIPLISVVGIPTPTGTD